MAPRRRAERVLLVAAVSALGLALTATSYFYADDFTYASLFRDTPLGHQLVFRSYFGHLVPGFAMFAHYFYTIAGLNWPAASVFMIATLAWLVEAVVHLIDSVLGPVRASLLGGAIAGLSLPVVTLVLWWNAAVTNLVPLAAGISFMACVSSWVTTRSKRTYFVALGFYALALAFYEKSLLYSATAFGWCWLVVDSEAPLSTRVRRALARWPIWLGIAVLSLLDLGVYMAGPYRAESGPMASVDAMTTFSIRGVILGLIPSFLGADLGLPATRHLQWLAIVALLLASLLVVITSRRSRLARGVWAFVFGAVVLEAVPLAIGRAGLAGPDGARLLRYQIEGAVFLAVGGAVAIAASQDRALRAHSKKSASLRSWSRIAGIVAAFAVAGTWSWSLAETVNANPGTASRQWVAQLNTLVSRGQGHDMLDSPMPSTFLFAWQYPYNMASHALPLLNAHFSFTTNPRGAWVVAPDGSIGPASFRSTYTSMVGKCVAAGTPLIVALPQTTGPTQIRIRYSSNTAQSLQVLAGTGTDLADPSGLMTPYVVRAGSGEIAAYARGTSIDRVSVAGSGGGLCIDSVDLGVYEVSSR